MPQMGLTGAAMAWQLPVFRLPPTLAETFPLSRHVTIDSFCLCAVFKELKHWFEQLDTLVSLLTHHSRKREAI